MTRSLSSHAAPCRAESNTTYSAVVYQGYSIFYRIAATSTAGRTSLLQNCQRFQRLAHSAALQTGYNTLHCLARREKRNGKVVSYRARTSLSVTPRSTRQHEGDKHSHGQTYLLDGISTVEVFSTCPAANHILYVDCKFAGSAFPRIFCGNRNVRHLRTVHTRFKSRCRSYENTATHAFAAKFKNHT